MRTPIKPECIGQALRLLRTQRGLTQKAAAKKAKITKAMLSCYETGRHVPSLQSSTAVLKVLKCDFHSFQEAMLAPPEGERPQGEKKVPRIQCPAKIVESVLKLVGSLSRLKRVDKP